MKSLFGRININKRVFDSDLLENALSSFIVYSNTNKNSKVFDNSGFGHISFTPEQNELFVNNASQFILLSDCRIDNKTDLIRLLNISEETISDDYILFKAIEKWSYDCVNYILGDFAFAIWDHEKQELFCVRDHFGLKPFYYFFDGKTFVFSSEIKAILSQKDLNFSIDQQYIADALSIVKSGKDKTTYNEIKKLPPAHYLTLKKNHLEVKEYWQLKPQKTIDLDDKQIIDQFKNLLFEAVKCRIQKDVNIGSELSGGLDSSSIAAIASNFTDIKTFSHVMPDHLLGKIHPIKDEREFINCVTDFCKIKDKLLVTSETTGITENIQQNIIDLGFISQQNFGAFSDHLYQKAFDEKVNVLLSGFGGDEVITSKSGTYLDELAKIGLWNEIKLDLKNQNLSKFKYFKTIVRLIIKIKFPKLFSLLSKIISKKPWWESKFENLALNQSFAEKMKIRERYFSQYDNSVYYSLQEKNIERITHQHVSQRLEYSSSATRKYGIEYRYPFLDKRLIEFYLAMPARLKARDGIARYAIREAMEGILPQQIQWRNDKSGATIPTVFMRTLNDQDKISDVILRAKSNEKIKKYIDLDKYENWFNQLKLRSQKKQLNINPGAFYNYLKIILFIEQNPNLFE